MEKSEQIQPHTWILGVDVSKQSIDVSLIRCSDGQLFENKFHNNLSGFRHLKRWCKEFHCECDASTLLLAVVEPFPSLHSWLNLLSPVN